ncbi:MAG TPA: membrane protein insertase YidC [Chitinophagaceae bacterium]|nr:membrane protein insertase YidC [Chitinophagaceae bacterium]HRX92946.1 membrane protein insertase YidC [Chitinophagaceae bacterium]
MKFDRNTVIGFTVLALLFIGYFAVTNKQQAEYRKQQAIQKAYDDSVALANRPKQDTIALQKDSLQNDSLQKVASAGSFQNAANGEEKLVQAENNLVKITFTNKGGQVKSVELKNYKEHDSSLVKLAGTDFDQLAYTINTSQNKTVSTGELFFTAREITTGADGAKVISFQLNSSDSNATSIIHKYTIRPDDYMIDFSVEMNGMDQLLTQGIMNLSWKYAASQQESDITFEKRNTQIGYVKDGDFDYHTISRRSSKDFDESVSWVGIRQRFFFSALVAKNNFSSGRMQWTIPPDSTKEVVQSTANMKVMVDAASSAAVNFELYYGPSDYKVLKSYNMKFEKLVNLGQGIYAFVRPINRYVIMPIFSFFQRLTGSMGIAIALLTLFIRLLTSPLIYKSYLSGAKMKALRPEIAKLKDKFGEDRQAMSMEQMKLFREAGVNPLGGCIPALLQIPIFFALFTLFNSDVALRGAPFLWSTDLSAFDDPIRFGFNIPLLGGHLSLFNITAVITSFLISFYSMSMTPDQSNPVMKYLPYIFPIFLLFFFNTLPSALTWYYTVSNTITLVLQIIIQRYIIDHDKILAKIAENRKKPKTKSKWQERLEQMQDQQKKMKEMQNRNKR